MLTVARLRFHPKMTMSGQKQTLSRWVKPHIDNTKCICVLFKQRLATPAYPRPSLAPLHMVLETSYLVFLIPVLHSNSNRRFSNTHLLKLCVCVCVCYTCVSARRYTRLIQKSTQAIFLYCSSPYFLREDLHWTWVLLTSQGPLVSPSRHWSYRHGCHA